MGLFGKLFGGGSPEKDMYTLLHGPSVEMADEMERVYRGQLDIYSEDYSATEISARGVLKARLFGATFMLVAFTLKWRETQHIDKMMQATSGIGMLAFESSNCIPQLSKKDAVSFAGDYIMKVLKAILAEVKQAPSTPDNPSEGLEKLVKLWVEALMESIEAPATDMGVHNRFYPMIAGGINTNMQHMYEWRKSL